MSTLRHLLLLSTVLVRTWAHTHEFFWTVSNKMLSPDGEHERQVITINDEWPAPQVRVHKSDRVVVHLTNNLTEETTACHFHGIFQKGSSYMDGAAMISQCPIPPGETFTYNFTVGDQTGTYWYHSHNVAQYGDGFRGVFIIEDDDTDLKYDEDLAITLSDWYHTPSQKLADGLFAPKSFGSEPHIDSSLFNETASQNIKVEPGKTYLLRVVNVGMSATQYLYIEDHMLTVVEIDGVRVEPVEVGALNLATGQRYSVLFTAKDNKDKNYPLVQITNIMMSKRYTVQWLVYDDSFTMDSKSVEHKKANSLDTVDDITLRPVSQIPLLKPTRQIILNFSSNLFGDSQTFYYTINGHPHLSPKVPTINTIFSGNSTSVLDSKIYGQATNAILLNSNEIIEIIVNSDDHMRHPFHLHGHNFQVVDSHSNEHYDPKAVYEYPKFPMRRDTVNLPGRGFIALRFKADNPGVWFFHCHTEWHAVQGLGVVFVEAPDLVLENEELPLGNRKICERGGVVAMGNAAGNEDMEDMKGEVEMLVPFGMEVSHTMSTQVLGVTSTGIASEQMATETLSNDSTETGSSGEDSSMVETTSLREKCIVLGIYALIMTGITGCFALVIQKSTSRKKRAGRGLL